MLLSNSLLLSLIPFIGDTGQQSTPPLPQPEQGNPVDQAAYPGAPLEDQRGHWWFATVQKGLIRYDGREFSSLTTREGLPGNMIRGLHEDREGLLWIATVGGVATYDGKELRVLTEYRDTEVHSTFSPLGDHRDIWSIFEDRDGQIWISTLGGVFRWVDEAFEPFPLPVQGSAERSEFSPRSVSCIYQDPNGHYWFGTDGAGAVKWDAERWSIFTVAEHGLCSDRVTAILEDRRGNLWFGTSDGGVTLYDGETYSTHLRGEEFSPHHGWGRYLCIYEDRQGDVWFGVANAGGGVYRHDGETFRHYTGQAGLGLGGVPSIREDRRGNLWLGTTSGVFRREGDRFVPFSKP